MRTYKSTQNETYTCYGENSGFSTCQIEIFLQSNLHCHLVKPQLFAVSRTDLLSSLEPNHCCYPECHFKKGAQKGAFFPQYILAQRTIEVLNCQQARVRALAEDAFSVASQQSIGLIDIKLGTYMRPQSRYVT